MHPTPTRSPHRAAVHVLGEAQTAREALAGIDAALSECASRAAMPASAPEPRPAR